MDMLPVGFTRSLNEHGGVGKKFSGEFAHGLGDWRGHPLLVRLNESAVAVGRLRPGAAGVYFVRDDQRRALVLSAYPPRTDCAKTPAGWLGFGRDLCDHAVVGYRVAASFVSGSSNPGNHLVPRGACCLRRGRSVDRLECLWPESAQRAPCNVGTHGHAPRVSDLSARTLGLAKNPRPRTVAGARAMGNGCPTQRLDVHQRADGIRAFASRHRAVSIARRKTEYGECMVWLVAMDCILRSVFDMGDLRYQVRAGVLSGRRHEGISRAVQPNCASPGTGPLLSPSPTS